MDDFGLRIRPLPASVVIKKFVDGVGASNYEVFLRELLNESDLFKDKGSGAFEAPASEEAGQCDAIAPGYEIDFKLLASQTELMARSIFTLQPVAMPDGITLYLERKVPRGEVAVTFVHVALRGLSVGDLERIRLSKTNGTNCHNDLPEVLETMETQKNILLFYPYVLSFEGNPCRDDAIGVITKALGGDFENLFLYRERKAPSFDTFFTAVFGGEFLIFRSERGAFRFIESVPTVRMPTYELLLGYADGVA